MQLTRYRNDGGVREPSIFHLPTSFPKQILTPSRCKLTLLIYFGIDWKDHNSCSFWAANFGGSLEGKGAKLTDCWWWFEYLLVHSGVLPKGNGRQPQKRRPSLRKLISSLFSAVQSNVLNDLAKAKRRRTRKKSRLPVLPFLALLVTGSSKTLGQDPIPLGHATWLGASICRFWELQRFSGLVAVLDTIFWLGPYCIWRWLVWIPNL